METLWDSRHGSRPFPIWFANKKVLAGSQPETHPDDEHLSSIK